MKGINIKSCFGIGLLCFSLIISGCLSIQNSPTPRFYILRAVNDNHASKKINIASDVVISVGPVKIPEVINRPQMVTQNKVKMLKFAEFDRWGESLDLGMARLIREDLTVLLPGAKLTLYPSNPSVAVKYQVIVEVIQLDSELDRDMFLAVQWMVIDVPNSKTLIIKRFESRQPIIPQNYPGLAKTLSTACASLSSQIAEALASLKTK
jgi:uncharacterized lipoprotein YmbA